MGSKESKKGSKNRKRHSARSLASRHSVLSSSSSKNSKRHSALSSAAQSVLEHIQSKSAVDSIELSQRLSNYSRNSRNLSKLETVEDTKAAEDTPKVLEDTPNVAEDTPKVPEDTPNVAEDTSKAAEDTPKVAEDTLKAAEDTDAKANAGDKKMKDKDKANIGLVELILEKFSQDKEQVIKEEINKSIQIINNINFKDVSRMEKLMKQDVLFNQQ